MKSKMHLLATLGLLPLLVLLSLGSASAQTDIAKAIEHIPRQGPPKLQSVRREFHWDSDPAVSAADVAEDLLRLSTAASHASSSSKAG